MNANKVNVTLHGLKPAADKAAAAEGLTTAAWIAKVVAEKLGKPDPEIRLGFANLSARRRKQIAKAGAAARHSPE